jgi:hypothetical protein
LGVILGLGYGLAAGNIVKHVQEPTSVTSTAATAAIMDSSSSARVRSRACIVDRVRKASWRRWEQAVVVASAGWAGSVCMRCSCLLTGASPAPLKGNGSEW